MKETEEFKYKAFISYSHAADGKLAPELQSALHKFAKPWYKLRAMRVFRDESNLTDNPDAPGLWSAIVSALHESEHFLLLASPTAAQSKWIHDEVDQWLARHGVKNLTLVLTEGEIAWDRDANDFDWDKTTALPRNVAKVFTEEPWFADLRFARTTTDLSPQNPDFWKPVGRIAARIHRCPYDEIVGQDVGEHRKFKLFARSMFAGLVMLLIAAFGAAWIAWSQRNIARQNEAVAMNNLDEALVGYAGVADMELNKGDLAGAESDLRYMLSLAKPIDMEPAFALLWATFADYFVRLGDGFLKAGEPGRARESYTVAMHILDSLLQVAAKEAQSAEWQRFSKQHLELETGKWPGQVYLLVPADGKTNVVDGWRERLKETTEKIENLPFQ